MTGDAPPESGAATSQPPPGHPQPSVPNLPEPPPDLPPVPGDADDTRGWHFRRLLGSGLVLGLTAILAIIALLAVGTQAGFGIGAAAAGGVLLIALVVVWAIASSRAASDFFRAYAASARPRPGVLLSRSR